MSIQQTHEMIHHTCPRCGHKMDYTGGKHKVKCSNCGYNRVLGRSSDQVDNHPLKAGVSLKNFRRGMGDGLSSYTCESCGTTIAREENKPPPFCPICRSEDLTPSDLHKKTIFPKGIIPFTVSEKQARDQLGQVLKSRFLPGELRGLTEPAQIQGVYVPIFVFDALTRSTWRVESGFRVLEKRKNRPEERMNWEPTAGYYEHFFEDFDVPIIAAIPEFPTIYDYDLSRVVDYDPRFLRGFSTELYQFREMDTFEMADQMMGGEIERAARDRMKGESIRKLNIRSEKFAMAFRHILVPVWIGVFHYQGETYTYLINGQTGTMNGQNPLSTRKIVIAVAAGVAVIVLSAFILG